MYKKGNQILIQYRMGKIKDKFPLMYRLYTWWFKVHYYKEK